ncbi:MAG: Bcr/CflA family multidrug efflux MFS transporter [Rhodospirillales bacterium]
MQQPTGGPAPQPARWLRIERIVILGAMISMAPMGIDMYLPSLPELERAFAAAAGQVQLTLSTFFLGFALGQAVYGPISDRFGRRPPLFAGLALFAAASVACAYAPTIEALTGLRFLQAIGACAGMVIARAMVRDLFDVRDAARVFSALMLVVGLAPILAPLLGGYLLLWFGWRAIFLSLAAFGVAVIALAWLRLGETRKPGPAGSLKAGAVAAVYLDLLKSRRFMGYALSGGVTISGMFAYIAGSPFVFIELYGVPAQQFGWLFGANALGLVLAAQVNGRLMRSADPHRVLAAMLLVEAGAGLALLAAALTGIGGLVGVWLPLLVFVSGLGLVMPNATALAMAPHGEHAGAASALLGVMQFGLASLAATALGAIQADSAVPMALVVAGAGALGLAVNRALVGNSR